MQAAYLDKLDGKITNEFWQRIQASWLSDELRLKGLISGMEESKTDGRLLDLQRILELAQKAYYLYLTRKPAEQGS